MQIAFRLNLEQQKKRAKELLKEFQRDQATAISRFEQQHPKLINKEHTVTTFEAKLADAQLVIARECGCKSWNRLRSHIVLMDSLRGRINRADVVADEPAGCLHIRCGSDIKANALLKLALKGIFWSSLIRFALVRSITIISLKSVPNFCVTATEQSWSKIIIPPWKD